MIKGYNMKEDDYKKTGLSNKEATERLEKYGLNELVKYKKPNPFLRLLSIFSEPMFLLLLGAAFLYILLKEPREAIIMMVFVGFVASITFVQEWRTEKMLHALKELTSPQVTVIRDGIKTVIPSIDLVPEDIVIIEEGQRIPADIEVLEYSGFSVDESSLTGESEPVQKTTKQEFNMDSSEFWKPYFLYAGTLSVSGKCVGIVRSTGALTEYGKIGKALSSSKDQLTPLQRKTKKLVKVFAIGGLFLCILVMIFSYIRSLDLIKSVLAGVTLAMAIIPEEFPVVLVIFLSMGAFRMAKQSALLRKIAAVETLGSATVLCVDKTGTLTKNQMTVIDSFRFKVDSTNIFNLEEILVLASEKDPFDPMEKAIQIFSGKTRESIEENKELVFIKNYPFDPQLKMMANEYKLGIDYCITLKGSAETLLGMCTLNAEEKKQIEIEIDKMAIRGLRVLAAAESCGSEKSIHLNHIKFTFKGLIGLQDPPKDGVPESIKICQEAGIRVVMITGDYEKTAIAIGKQIGLKFSQNTISGHLLDKLSSEELAEAVKECDIFSRVIPEQKMKIVQALKKNGEIVAMTGDGVNDAPALKLSDIGIAMGKRGTEVAKEAADMILMDDNFTTIVQSVKDGRRIYDNIRKAMVYIMIIHIPIAGTTLLSPLFNLSQILLPIHIVLLELIIDPTCSIVFEGEEAEPNVMKRPPRSPAEPLLDPLFLWKVIIQGLCILAATFFPFHYLSDSGVYTIEIARSFALATLVSCNIFLVLINRSNTHYLFQIFTEKQNSARIWINGIAFLILLGLIYVPFLNQWFKTSPLPVLLLVIALVLGFVATAWWEIVKLVINYRQGKLLVK
jgi:Ca2+-transporting ATPase